MQVGRILMAKERVTVIDIARAAGVSKSTVSLVLQGSSLVNEATRAKVNAVIRELGYVYNRSAANLRQATSKIIGIVVNDLTNSFFAELAVGVPLDAGHMEGIGAVADGHISSAPVQAQIRRLRRHGGTSVHLGQLSGLRVDPERQHIAAAGGD